MERLIYRLNAIAEVLANDDSEFLTFVRTACTDAAKALDEKACENCKYGMIYKKSFGEYELCCSAVSGFALPAKGLCSMYEEKNNDK